MMYDNIINLHDSLQTDKDLGSAHMHLELKDSVITMRHGDSKEVLCQFDAIDGDWVTIVHLIKQMGKRR